MLEGEINAEVGHQVQQLAKELLEAVAKDITEKPDGSLVISLRVPIHRKNERVEAVTLRRPTCADFMLLDMTACSRGDLRNTVPFIHAISNLTRQEIEGMDMADYNFLADMAIGRFLRRRPEQLAGAAR